MKALLSQRVWDCQEMRQNHKTKGSEANQLPNYLPTKESSNKQVLKKQNHTSIHSANWKIPRLPKLSVKCSSKEKNRKRLSAMESKPHSTPFLFCGHGLMNEAPQLPHQVFSSLSHKLFTRSMRHMITSDITKPHSYYSADHLRRRQPSLPGRSTRK